MAMAGSKGNPRDLVRDLMNLVSSSYVREDRKNRCMKRLLREGRKDIEEVIYRNDSDVKELTDEEVQEEEEEDPDSEFKRTDLESLKEGYSKVRCVLRRAGNVNPNNPPELIVFPRYLQRTSAAKDPELVRQANILFYGQFADYVHHLNDGLRKARAYERADCEYPACPGNCKVQRARESTLKFHAPSQFPKTLVVPCISEKTRFFGLYQLTTYNYVSCVSILFLFSCFY